MDEKKDSNEAEDRLSELRRQHEELKKARAKKALANEEKAIELELQYEKELGSRGAHFEMIDLTHMDEGFVVVKLGDGVVHNRFVESKQNEADLADFVRPNVVYPAKSEYDAIAHRRPGVAHQCAHALLSLYGLKANADAKKA